MIKGYKLRFPNRTQSASNFLCKPNLIYMGTWAVWIFLQSFCRLTSLCFVLDPNSTTCPEMIGVLLSITSFFEEVVVVYSMISISVSSSWNTEIIGKKIWTDFSLHLLKKRRLKIQNSAVLHEEISKWNWPKLLTDLSQNSFAFCLCTRLVQPR